jgi:lipopolysaccharide export system permease protein
LRILTRFLLRSFLPIFLAALSFFVLIVQLVDLFANLVRYLNLEVPLAAILDTQLLFLPSAIAYALPVALLFATGFTLGTLYSNNELIAVFGAGVPIWRFTAPLVIGGMILSVGIFFFQEYLVIDTLRAKNELSRQLLNITRSFSNTNVTTRSPSGAIIYSAEYYNDGNQELSRVLILERDRDGSFRQRIDASFGRWDGERWVWRDGTRFFLESTDADNDEGTADPSVDPPVNGAPRIASEPFDTLRDDRFDLPPRAFQRNARDVDEMRFDEAREWVVALRDAGQPYRRALTDYYSRFSFAMTPFIVVLISSALGGRFRRNILLMSLLISLVTAVVYYVTGMVSGILAGDGLIPPIIGAWSGVVLFSAIGVILFRTAKT